MHTFLYYSLNLQKTLAKGKKKKNDRLLINEGITAPELRVLIDGEEGSFVMKREEALEKAREMGLDLIEISANANPPVAKITDYGKYMYAQKKKQKEIKARQKTVEVKNIQIKIGTGEADLKLKAQRASKWLEEGDRVKVELYLRGRAKYMDKNFLRDRLTNVLSLISSPYKIVEDFKQSPKGFVILIEPDKKAKTKKDSSPKKKEKEEKKDEQVANEEK